MIVSGKARLAGVLGWPVSHSLSPRLHGYWLQRYGIDGAYLPLATPAAALERVVKALAEQGLLVRKRHVEAPEPKIGQRLHHALQGRSWGSGAST